MTDAADPGLEAVRSLREALQLDPEWTLDGERGFDWWPGPLCQRVSAREPVEDQGLRLALVEVSTHLATGLTGSDRELAALTEFNARAASMSALLAEPGEPSRLLLRTGVFVHSEVLPFALPLLKVAAALQLAESHQLLDAGFPADLGLTPAGSVHPRSGRRSARDGMVATRERLVVPAGQAPSRWRGEEIVRLARDSDHPPCILVSGDETGLAAELPFGEETSLLEVRTDEEHPILGAGLLVTLQLPWHEAAIHAARKAAELNAAEARGETFASALGAWSVGPAGGPAHAAFFPNLLAAPGLAAYLLLTQIQRARWVTEEVFGLGWEQYFEIARQNLLARYGDGPEPSVN